MKGITVRFIKHAVDESFSALNLTWLKLLKLQHQIFIYQVFWGYIVTYHLCFIFCVMSVVLQLRMLTLNMFKVSKSLIGVIDNNLVFVLFTNPGFRLLYFSYFRLFLQLLALVYVGKIGCIYYSRLMALDVSTEAPHSSSNFRFARSSRSEESCFKRKRIWFQRAGFRAGFRELVSESTWLHEAQCKKKTTTIFWTLTPIKLLC